MRRLGIAPLLALSLAAAGCGSSDDTSATTGTPTASVVVTASGTNGFVPIGTSGVSVSAPTGVIPQATTLSVTPLTSAAQVGSPFPGSDSFITGLQLGTSVSPLVQPAGFQVPIAQAIPAGTSVAGFQLGRSGWLPIEGVTTSDRSVTFSTDHPGTYVFVYAR